jgi:hypothetical protein
MAGLNLPNYLKGEDKTELPAEIANPEKPTV